MVFIKITNIGNENSVRISKINKAGISDPMRFAPAVVLAARRSFCKIGPIYREQGSHMPIVILERGFDLPGGEMIIKSGVFARDRVGRRHHLRDGFGGLVVCSDAAIGSGVNTAPARKFGKPFGNRYPDVFDLAANQDLERRECSAFRPSRRSSGAARVG